MNTSEQKREIVQGRHYNRPLIIKIALTLFYVILGPPIMAVIFSLVGLIFALIIVIFIVISPMATIHVAKMEIWTKPRLVLK